MRRAFSVFAVVLALVAVTSCSETFLPTAPPPPPMPPSTPPESGTTSFVGNIMDADTLRVCIENASAQIIRGPASGTVYLQNREYCEDPGGGFVINDLAVGTVLSLRVSASGYTSVDRDFVIARSAPSIDINLKRAG